MLRLLQHYCKFFATFEFLICAIFCHFHYQLPLDVYSILKFTVIPAVTIVTINMFTHFMTTLKTEYMQMHINTRHLNDNAYQISLC